MTSVPVITTLVAKILIILDRLLSEWVVVNISTVNVGNASHPYVGNCVPYLEITSYMTPCGSAFVEVLEDVIHNGFVLVSHVLVGLNAWESYPVSG